MCENWIKVAVYQKVTSEAYISLFQLALSTHLRVRSVNFPPGSPEHYVQNSNQLSVGSAFPLQTSCRQDVECGPSAAHAPYSLGTLVISLAICFIITEHFPVE